MSKTMMVNSQSDSKLHIRNGAILYSESTSKVPPYYSRPGPGAYQADQTNFNDSQMEVLSQHNKS